MVRKYVGLTCVLVILILSGCANHLVIPPKESEMERFVRDANIMWKGKTAYALVKQAGKADRLESDGAGGYILVWIEQRPVKTPVYGSYNAGTNQNNNVYQPPVYQQPQNSVTEGELKWNTYFDKWEWKSQTTTSPNSPNPLESIIQAQNNVPKSFTDTLVENQTRIIGYTTSYKILELRFYINSSDKIYLFNIKER